MKRFWTTAAGVAVAVALGGSALAADWQPEQPITIIVPWAAGGSTDQVTRVVAGELEEALGESVVIVNQPGASGSVGTKNAWDAPHDATPGPPARHRISAPTRSSGCSIRPSTIGGSISVSPMLLWSG